MLRRAVFLAFSIAAVSGPISPAHAAHKGFGVRAGFSIDPDQVVLGGHYVISAGDVPILTWVLPVVELGLGDDITVLTVGTDLQVRPFKNINGWELYGGGELAINYYNFDGGNETDLGVMALVGIDKDVSGNRTLGFELKVDLVDSPDLKFLVTYTFGR